MKESKGKKANSQKPTANRQKHKKPWQEKYATPEQIKTMLDSRVSLRYNEVRGRTEIHWLSQGPVLREDEQGLLTIFGGEGGAQPTATATWTTERVERWSRFCTPFA